MCRIFAVRSRKPVAVHGAFDGLRKLAAEHKDGWGIASFNGDERKVEVRVNTAEHCPRFVELGREPMKAVAVHIRLASVGTVHERNNHPFVAGKWVFMHNGTLKKFAQARPALEAEIDPAFRAELRGETDSECCFALFRTYLGEASDTTSVERALCRVFRTAERICDPLPGEKRSAMNFLATDGTRFFATRRDRTLYVTANDELAAIASEKLHLDGAQWQPVPMDHLVTIDEHLALTIAPIP
jgi:glutamine amidotransferase